ncbi:hypothetical protein CRG98_038856 [Punica granatum]|uniref:Uncharacterized protein n=1 Tax=Punica granatum TaxID=22663 RepID=A0A2I0IAR8_PUNGR|nr:hypothetical protein CRG98_038856 [Punica granatum]
MARTAVRALAGGKRFTKVQDRMQATRWTESLQGRRCEQMGGRNKREGDERRVVVGVLLRMNATEREGGAEREKLALEGDGAIK